MPQVNPMIVFYRIIIIVIVSFHPFYMMDHGLLFKNYYSIIRYCFNSDVQVQDRCSVSFNYVIYYAV